MSEVTSMPYMEDCELHRLSRDRLSSDVPRYVPLICKHTPVATAIRPLAGHLAYIH